MSQLTQNCLGQSLPAQQVTWPKVFWINLLHLNAAHEQPQTDSHGGTRILVCWQIPVCPASGMHGFICAFVFILYPVCTSFSGEVHCKHSTYSITCLLSITHFGIEGNSLNVDLWWIFGWGEWTNDYLAQVQLPQPEKRIQKSNPHRLKECAAAPPRKQCDRHNKKQQHKLWCMI